MQNNFSTKLANTCSRLFWSPHLPVANKYASPLVIGLSLGIKYDVTGLVYAFLRSEAHLNQNL